MILYVLKGMTQVEVLKILGEPYKTGIGPDNSWHYGESSLVFDDPRGIADQIIEADDSISRLQGNINEPYNARRENRRKEKRTRDALHQVYQVKTIHISDSCL